MTTTDNQQLRTWSLLSPTPACAWHARSNSHVVYWHGVAMTRASALIITGHCWQTVWASPKMKLQAWEQFIWAYRLGAFGSVNWSNWIDNRVDPAGSYHAQLIKWMQRQGDQVLTDMINAYSVQTALTWFMGEELTLA